MVRTKADSSFVKAAGAKAPRKISFSAHSCGGASSSDCGKVKQNIGGNPYFPHETPSWQKEITSFFKSAAVDSMKKTQIPSNEESSQEITMEAGDSSAKDASQP
ncbi:PCNA-associated factor-like [Zootermopsis nevadensis]|uniref:PCNA-associated factor n=1 Tax=Zootermopsis nevadensis TaxID=136037 RepID=A0A067QJ89_ZOONE|nr:PCNA-associated factor-like [Zootermopsis nevadensis]KDR09006.1 PCNA-associated factor [Zootermopsis nevadensis]